MKQESQSFLYAINVRDSGTIEGIMPQMPHFRSGIGTGRDWQKQDRDNYDFSLQQV
jgi:hypothetical protein